LRFRAVRQAINYGFDRRKMMLYLRNSLGLPAESGFVPAGLPSFDSAKVRGYHFDPVKARQLLATAGYPDGKGIGTVRLLTVPNYADFANYIARQLEDIGLHVQVEVVQKSLLLEETAQSEALFFRGSWIADYPDAENYLSVFYSRNPAPPNYTRYNDPEFDRLYEAALRESSDSLRYDLYRKMDQRVMDASPVIPLWYDEVVHLINPRVRGLQPNGLNLLELRRVDFVNAAGKSANRAKNRVAGKGGDGSCDLYFVYGVIRIIAFYSRKAGRGDRHPEGAGGDHARYRGYAKPGDRQAGVVSAVDRLAGSLDTGPWMAPGFCLSRGCKRVGICAGGVWGDRAGVGNGELPVHSGGDGKPGALVAKRVRGGRTGDPGGGGICGGNGD
jgi:hypothetical protein